MDPTDRLFVGFKLLDPEYDRLAWFPATTANTVAAMTRHATAEAAKYQPKEWVDHHIHGHRRAGAGTMAPISELSLPAHQHPDELLNRALQTRRLSREHPQTAEYMAGFQDALAGKGDHPWQSGRGFHGGQAKRWRRGYQDAKTLLAGRAIQRGPGNSPEELAERRRRQREEQSFPAEGHTMHRFSYLPLPTIERRGQGAHVVGGIRRVIVGELVETSESQVLWARQMLPGQFLTGEHSGKRRAMLAPLNDNDWVLRQYTEPSETWATVTPIVLPGSDQGKYSKAEKLFFKSLRHAGYSPDAIAELEFRNVSFWPGGELAQRFQLPDYLKKNKWSVYHVRLGWKARVNGPLALGAGRHCGLGIFAKMEG
jgi:hypothetical protein